MSLVGSAGITGGSLREMESSIRRIAESSFIDQKKLSSLIVAGWESAVEIAFQDDVLSHDEEKNLDALQNHFSIPQEQLNNNGAYEKLIKGVILREVLNGTVPEKLNIEGNLPFNLQKSEKIVWLFQDVKYYEEKSRTRYVGGSQGVSIRVAKGIYYRTGGFKGERVQESETIHADTGLLGITNKHVYFAGPSKRFRIAFNKIVAFEPFSDGIGVQRDAQTAKPQTFVTGDGWFTYNLVTNLARI